MATASPKSSSQISTLDDTPDPIAVADAAAPVVLVGTNHESGFSGKKELVTIHSVPGEGGSDAVFLSHNGYAYNVPRDTPSLMPTEVVQGCIRDAKVTTYSSGPQGAVIEKTTPRFAFSATPA